MRTTFSFSTALLVFLVKSNSVRNFGTTFIVIDQTRTTLIAHMSAFVEADENRAIPMLLPEILGEIFSYTIGDHYTGHSSQPMPHSALPWSISHVSRRWRDIALSRSDLWSQVPCITLSSTKHRGQAGPPFMQYLEEILRRSKATPICVYIRGRFHPHLHTHFVDVFLSNVERVKFLRIRCPDMINLLAGVKGRLQSLELLSVVCNVSILKSPCDLFEISPRLSNVHIDIQDPPTRLLLPTRQIRDYFCSIKHGSDIEHIVLPRAEYLCIYGRGCFGQVQRLLERSNYSNIQILNLSGELHDTLRASGRLCAILQSTPFLKKLKIESIAIHDIERLADTTSNKVLVPYLHTFQLSAQLCDDSLQFFTVLQSLASVRCEDQFDPTRNVARLEILQVLFYKRFSPHKEGHRALESWIPGQSSSRLHILNDKLLSLCPEGDINKSSEEREGLVSMSKRYTDGRKTIISAFWEELKQLQNQDPKELVLSDLLYNILYLINQHKYTSKHVYPFWESTVQCIQEWKPLLMDAVASLTWIVTENGGFMYLPQNDNRRRTKNILESHARGLSQLRTHF